MPESVRDENTGVTIQVNDDGSINVKLLDASGNPVKFVTDYQFLPGTAGSGATGDLDQTFTLTTSDDVAIIGLWLNGSIVIPVTNYSIDNSAKTITFVNMASYDSDTIAIQYRH